jgi:hypothetical protein
MNPLPPQMKFVATTGPGAEVMHIASGPLPVRGAGR